MIKQMLSSSAESPKTQAKCDYQINRNEGIGQHAYIKQYQNQ